MSRTTPSNLNCLRCSLRTGGHQTTLIPGDPCDLWVSFRAVSGPFVVTPAPVEQVWVRSRNPHRRSQAPYILNRA